ncbi:MAG: fused MFS/spermidine synthase [Thermoanaerobaculia bacterium]
MPSTVAYRLRFLVAVVVLAAVLMALEIVSSRLLAPSFGNSVYVWGSIIGVFLAAMSCGYMLGGAFADRRPQLSALSQLLLLAALFEAATGIFGRSAVAAIGEATGGRPVGTLLATTLLFGPATLLLATVAPFAVRLAGLDRERLGNVSGRLFALSTAGSLAGTLCATFVLIPALALDSILSLLVSATALAGFAAASGRWDRFGALALAALVWFSPHPRSGWQTVVVERATPYQTLVVRESDGERTLSSDGSPHGGIVVATGQPTLRYVFSAETMRLFTPRPGKLLLLGLGSGGVGRLLSERTPGLSSTYVEIDPAVVDIAKREFGLQEGPRMRVVEADARRFVADSRETWDWIYCDTYIGRAVPFHLATRAFFEEVRKHLAPGGTFGLNLAGSIHHPFSRAIYRTLHQVFARVEVFSIRGSANLLLIARDGGPMADSELSAHAAALDAGASPALGGARFAALAAQRMHVDLDLAAVPVLEDQFAPVDALLNLADERATLPGASGVR